MYVSSINVCSKYLNIIYVLTIEMCFIICLFTDYSKVDFVLFETVGTLRDALIRDWTMLSQDQKNELREYLFRFIMSDGNIAPFVRERILQVILFEYFIL